MNERSRTLVSVLTPTWNRAEYLSDVWKGLSSQTVRSFEWIVANDGSEDNTVEVVRKLADKSDFPVIIVNASLRIGKSRMDNEAVQQANGEFIIWCDSDDVLLPDAIDVLLKAWESIDEHERGNYAGVTALCEAEGVALGKEYPSGKGSDLPLNDLLYRMRSDLVIFTRSELLKKSPFKEVDFLISESSVWNQIGGKLTRFVPRVLKKVRYGEKNCLSLSGKMRYNRGHAHAIALTHRFARKNITTRERLWRIVNFGRYCIHGDISLFYAVRNWRDNSGSALALIALLPISLLMSIKDRLQNKVEKTHLEFEKAIEIVEFSREVLN
ncbi:MAG: glycosyltransferase family A protein [Halioglobus sp.]